MISKYKKYNKGKVQGLEIGTHSSSFDKTFISLEEARFVLKLLNVDYSINANPSEVLDLFIEKVNSNHDNSIYIKAINNLFNKKELYIDNSLFKKEFISRINQGLLDEIIIWIIGLINEFNTNIIVPNFSENFILTKNQGLLFGVFNQKMISYQVANIIILKFEELLGEKLLFIDIFEKNSIANKIKLSQVFFTYNQNANHIQTYNEAIDLIKENVITNNEEYE